MAKSRARRNVIVVAVMFGIVGALILLAGSIGGPPVISPEPPEISRIRLSKTENGYFALMDAVQSLPECPVTPSLTDPDFERGPKAQLLDVPLKEDAPAIAATIEGSRPAVDAARNVVRMPHLLAPVDWKTFGRNPYEPTSGFHGLYRLFDRMFLVGLEDARAAATEEQAIELVLDSYRLLWRSVDEVGLRLWATRDMFARAWLVLGCPPSFQQRLLAGLKELRAQWRPPEHWLDNALRMFEIRRSSLHGHMGVGNARHVVFILSEYARAARVRPLLASNYDILLSVSAYSRPEFLQWEEKNPELAEAADFGMFDFRLSDICEANSAYLLGLDGLMLVLTIEQYRRDHDAYPETLDSLVPACFPVLPLDPCTNQPFGYRLEAGSYRLYSYGHDGRDNGGQRYHSSDFAIHLPPEY